MSGAQVITVDGPAASGKGTIASGLGRQFGLPVLDSGLLYRAVGVLLEREGGRRRHTSELQSRRNLVCRLLLEKKKNK